MRGAFVVQLRRAAEGNQLEGLVEEVDTGEQAKFLSEDELIGFLRERFAHVRPDYRGKEGTNERNDDRE